MKILKTQRFRIDIIDLLKCAVISSIKLLNGYTEVRPAQSAVRDPADLNKSYPLTFFNAGGCYGSTNISCSATADPENNFRMIGCNMRKYGLSITKNGQKPYKCITVTNRNYKDKYLDNILSRSIYGRDTNIHNDCIIQSEKCFTLTTVDIMEHIALRISTSPQDNKYDWWNAAEKMRGVCKYVFEKLRLVRTLFSGDLKWNIEPLLPGYDDNMINASISFNIPLIFLPRGVVRKFKYTNLDMVEESPLLIKCTLSDEGLVSSTFHEYLNIQHRSSNTANIIIFCNYDDLYSESVENKILTLLASTNPYFFSRLGGSTVENILKRRNMKIVELHAGYLTPEPNETYPYTREIYDCENLLYPNINKNNTPKLPILERIDASEHKSKKKSLQAIIWNLIYGFVLPTTKEQNNTNNLIDSMSNFIDEKFNEIYSIFSQMLNLDRFYLAPVFTVYSQLLEYPSDIDLQQPILPFGEKVIIMLMQFRTEAKKVINAFIENKCGKNSSFIGRYSNIFDAMYESYNIKIMYNINLIDIEYNQNIVRIYGAIAMESALWAIRMITGSEALSGISTDLLNDVTLGHGITKLASASESTSAAATPEYSLGRDVPTEQVVPDFYWQEYDYYVINKNSPFVNYSLHKLIYLVADKQNSKKDIPTGAIYRLHTKL